MATVDKITESIGTTLLKALITELKMLSPRFTHQSEEMQQEIIDRLRLQVGDQLREAVVQIAAKSYKSLPGTIVKVQFKDGVQCQINMNRTNKTVHDVADSVGGECMIVLCDLDEFVGGMEQAVKPVSRQMDLDDASD
jgi:hypothetical protein